MRRQQRHVHPLQLQQLLARRRPRPPPLTRLVRRQRRHVHRLQLQQLLARRRPHPPPLTRLARRQQRHVHPLQHQQLLARRRPHPPPLTRLVRRQQRHVHPLQHQQLLARRRPHPPHYSPPTTGPPTVTTEPATDVAISSARLNGTVNPHGLITMVHFQVRDYHELRFSHAPTRISAETRRKTLVRTSPGWLQARPIIFGLWGPISWALLMAEIGPSLRVARAPVVTTNPASYGTS